MNNVNRIADLNDQCRNTLAENENLVLSPGINSLLPAIRIEILSSVKSFNDFNEENDPYGEHDFGAFQYEGHSIYWKIQYYDMDGFAGSGDPGDASRTLRTLTIMLQEEYNAFSYL